MLTETVIRLINLFSLPCLGDSFASSCLPQQHPSFGKLGWEYKNYQPRFAPHQFLLNARLLNSGEALMFTASQNSALDRGTKPILLNYADSATPKITDTIVANIEDASTLTLCTNYKGSISSFR